MTRIRTIALLAGAVAVLPIAACSSYTKEENSARQAEERAQNYVEVEREARTTVQMFRDSDPTIARFFDSAVGWAVFPKITKGGAGIGGAHGFGVVYDNNGTWIGNTDVTQGSIGLQLGGQTFREIVFFQDQAAMRKFKNGNMEFSANASAVAVESGAGAAADFQEGVAVFTMTRAGLMFEASIGGQSFDYNAR
jgi:lipid-binding SYLF domain-containing protein